MANREIVLIVLSGEDRPGVTSSIAQGLADYDANILDIGQSVIHNNLNLGILAEVSDTSESSPLITDIRKRASQQEMQVSFEPDRRYRPLLADTVSFDSVGCYLLEAEGFGV